MCDCGDEVRVFSLLRIDGIRLKSVVVENLKRSATIYPGGHNGYDGLRGHGHEEIKHDVGIYVCD